MRSGWQCQTGQVEDEKKSNSSPHRKLSMGQRSTLHNQKALGVKSVTAAVGLVVQWYLYMCVCVCGGGGCMYVDLFLSHNC